MNKVNALLGLGLVSSDDTPTENDWLGVPTPTSTVEKPKTGVLDTISTVISDILKPGAEIYSTVKNGTSAAPSSTPGATTVNLPPLPSQNTGMSTPVKIALGVAGAAVVGGVVVMIVKALNKKEKKKAG